MILRRVDILSARREYHVTTSLLATLSRLKSLLLLLSFDKSPSLCCQLSDRLACQMKNLIIGIYPTKRAKKVNEMKIEIIGGAVPSRAK